MPHRHALAAVLLVLAAPALGAPASSAAVGATERFSGPDAAQQAGDYLTGAVAYAHHYNPGLLAVRYIPVHDNAFVTSVRFSPSLGHQVVLSKGWNAPDLQAGGSCADVRITVEHFSAGSLDEYHERQFGVRVLVRDLRRGSPIDERPAFATPYGTDRVGGGAL